MRIGFGLDLAGFTNTRGTVLAAICANDNSAEVAVFSNSPFNQKLDANTEFPFRLAQETAFLSRLVGIGSIAVDVPIDLQGLPCRDAIEAWQLTLRPVDKVLRALPPLASWLGACVARFGAILSPEIKKQLDVHLFETYPAASLQAKFGKCDSDVKQYKLSDKTKTEIAADARKRLWERLSIDPHGDSLSHDELDAIICALTAVATRDELLARDEYGLADSQALPMGYRLLNKKNSFDRIQVSRIAFDEWVKKNKVKQ